MSSGGSRLATIKRIFRRELAAAREIVENGRPVAIPPPGAESDRLGDPEHETSTNAQTEGAIYQPWSSNR